MTTFRNATLDELRQVLDWAAEEGWNPGLEDAEAFFQADPDGFFVATDATGDLIAAISVVNHTDDFAFLGLYIVRPAYRGQGVGLALWHHALRHAGQRTVGLDGVEAQQANYAASGFELAGGTTRFTGQVAGAPNPDIGPSTAQDLDDLIMREAAASGVVKGNYLRPWCTNTQTRTTFVSRGSDRITGFCTARRCRVGFKIGPLVAKDQQTAQHLIRHAAASFQGPVTLDVPAASVGLSALCQDLGLSAGFRTARMYRGPFSAKPADVFAVSSLELG